MVTHPEVNAPAWAARPSIPAVMLNPALFAALAAAAAEEYRRRSGHYMPWYMCFLVAPLVLHRSTREVLPRDTRTHMANWVSSHAVIIAGFPARARELVGPVQEGIRFGLRHDVLEIDQDGGLRGALSENARPEHATGDLSALIRAAGLIGRWLTKLDQPATAFALLGVTP
ncbi:three component ABC system middle component [Actinoplanes sp. NPDC026619]|uniref:three component ABC system middle component n=1 Tax=Actinoplanes sp. NPDC026619 TaxID=3155798 RepID=UPI0033F176BC